MQEKRLKILIVEDEQIYRSLALQVFDGCEKISAASAAEGFTKFKEHCPDITLLDIGLPDKSGLELLPQIINYDPEAFVVMLTFSRVSEDVKLARERGASGYIIKPFSYKKVSECIARYKEYKKKLQAMSAVERASNLIKNLKIEALHEDLNSQIQETLQQQDAQKTETSVSTLLEGWKVLFADDYLINRERAETQLKKLGCRVDIASSGTEVLDKVNAEGYNIVLIDSQMRDMDGYEVAKKIRASEALKAQTEKSLLIIMVENTDELDKRLWQKAGMNDFIKKPASFTKIKETIQKHAKRYLDSLNGEYVT